MREDHDKQDPRAEVRLAPDGPAGGLRGELIARFGRGHPAMTTEVRLLGGEVTIGVRGELDLATSEQLAAAVGLRDRAPCAGRAVTLDLTGVSFVDSTGLEEILRARSALGPRLTILSSQACTRLFRLAGVESRLPVKGPGDELRRTLDTARSASAPTYTGPAPTCSDARIARSR